MALRTLRRRSPHLLTRGFTLVELVAVTGIFVLLTGVILANHSSFGGMVTLENLAYDLALSVRQSQVYGISVRRFGADTFSAGYGVHFLLSSPTTYELFADAVNPSGLYDAGELVQQTTLNGNYRIVNLCYAASGISGEICGASRLDILFKRPEPDAYISVNGVSAVDNLSAANETGRVVIISPQGECSSVVVEVTGQISVQAAPAGSCTP